MSGPDKRKTRRKFSDYVVEFYDGAGLLLEGVGHLLDLSATGALVASSLRLKAGQTLRIRLRRGNRADMEIPVTVIRARGKGTAITYGLRFNRGSN